MSIGILAVILIVVLRIAIGWHYFYEGLHKMDPLDKFSAEGFLGQAKGPTADLYYAMLPDITGRERLEIIDAEDFQYYEFKETIELRTGYNQQEEIPRTISGLPTFRVYENAWNKYRNDFVKSHKLDDEDLARIESIYGQYILALREYAAEVREAVDSYQASLKRFEQQVADKTNDAPHQRERDWDARMAYRAEANQWLGELDQMGSGLQSAFGRVFAPELSGTPEKLYTQPEMAIIPNPIASSQIKLLDLSVTYGLTAIGLCLMLGFCTRLAALGAVAFLINVVLSQFPWPGVYPPTPSQIGNFLIVNKDMVELIACLVIASLPAGRWGGLDFFLWNFGGKQLAQAYGFVKKEA